MIVETANSSSCWHKPKGSAMVAVATIAVIITTTITHSVDSYIQWMDPDVRRVTGGFKDHLVSVCLLLHKRERAQSLSPAILF